MSLESSTLFKPLVSNQPLTVLLLIENSQQILSVWRELGECYLNPLMDIILRANDRALTSLAVIESSADTTGTLHPPRHIPLSPAALLNMKFDLALDGRISPSRVNDCIQHLDDCTYALDGSTALHLVIVAAATPSDDCSGLISTGTNSPWGLLADKLSERNIHCHLITASGEDVTPLTMLFNQTLYLQNNVEEAPPFHIDHQRYMVRLSARPFYPQFGDLEQNASTYAPVVNAMTATSRRNSHLDSHFDGNLPPSSGTAFTPQNEISLVSQLKMAQGLIKKKQHSKDPQPAPFIADVRVQDPPSQPYSMIPSSSPPSGTSPSSASSSSSTSTLASTSPPTSATSSLSSSIPLTSRHRRPQSLAMAGFSNVPPETIINPTNGGRAMSISKADRKQRVSQSTSGSSPTESVHAHMRRGSQGQPQAAIVGGPTNGSGQGGSPGSWYASSSHGLPQMQQVHTQRGSRLSTPDHDVPMCSPALSAALGPGSNGIGTSSSAGGRGATLDLSIGGANTGAPIASEIPSDSSAPPSVGMPGVVMANGVGNHDISPGSVSSYVSSDMSSPTTPGSTEDLSSYARLHALHRQGVTYQIPYQQNTMIPGSQDGLLQRQQSLQPSQMQEVSLLQHQEHLSQLHQTTAMQHPHHLYPGAYDPASNYFPAQATVPTQQYYLPQQSTPTQQPIVESVYQSAGGIQDETQQSSIPLQVGRQAIRPTQTLRHNSYPNARPLPPPSPPMIVPSQSHIPLTAVNQTTVVPSTTVPAVDTAIISRPSPPRPTITRTSTGPQGQGRTRASTVAISSNLKNTSPSKIAKSKRHKKSASSVSHSALLQSNIDSPVLSSVGAASSSGGDEIFEVPPLYAASTGCLFESMFNIKSGLLDGPSALANAEDIALVAPALGFGEGPNVLATLPIDVEAAGGLFRSRLKERGGVVDDVSRTALVPVPAASVTGTVHDDNPPNFPSTVAGQPPRSDGIQPFVDYSDSGSMVSSAGYPYQGQQLHYGLLNSR